MLQSPCGCPFRAVIILTLSVFSNDKLFGECWVYSKTCQLHKVSTGQRRSVCVVITPVNKHDPLSRQLGSAKTVVSCPRPNACPFMVRAHLIRLHSRQPFAHSSKQDVQSEGEELCHPINLAHIAIPFPLKFPRDSMHFISIRLVPCASENLNKQSNYQEVKMNPHQIYPLTQNWVMSA